MVLFLNYHHTYSNYASIKILLYSEIGPDFFKNGIKNVFFNLLIVPLTNIG